MPIDPPMIIIVVDLSYQFDQFDDCTVCTVYFWIVILLTHLKQRKRAISTTPWQVETSRSRRLRNTLVELGLYDWTNSLDGSTIAATSRGWRDVGFPVGNHGRCFVQIKSVFQMKHVKLYQRKLHISVYQHLSSWSSARRSFI